MGHRDARSVEKYAKLGSNAIRAGLERLHKPAQAWSQDCGARPMQLAQLLARLVTSAGSRLRFNVGDSDASEVAAQLIQLLKPRLETTAEARECVRD